MGNRSRWQHDNKGMLSDLDEELFGVAASLCIVAAAYHSLRRPEEAQGLIDQAAELLTERSRRLPAGIKSDLVLD